jgi:hypothetical protein
LLQNSTDQYEAIDVSKGSVAPFFVEKEVKHYKTDSDDIEHPLYYRLTVALEITAV